MSTTVGSRVLRVKAGIAFMCVAAGLYFWLMGRAGIALIQSGKPAAIGMGVGTLILPFIGAWAVVATLRAGFAHQRLAQLAAEQGRDLDVSGLRRMPSGRVNREDADALFGTVREEVERDGDDWVAWYRLARAYDYAGDRGRARETMRTAVRLEREGRAT